MVGKIWILGSLGTNNERGRRDDVALGDVKGDEATEAEAGAGAAFDEPHLVAFEEQSPCVHANVTGRDKRGGGVGGAHFREKVSR